MVRVTKGIEERLLPTVGDIAVVGLVWYFYRVS